MEQKQCENTRNFRTDAKEFLEELKPLIEDYFVCELIKEENALKVCFENGQVIRLCAQEL